MMTIPLCPLGQELWLQVLDFPVACRPALLPLCPLHGLLTVAPPPPLWRLTVPPPRHLLRRMVLLPLCTPHRLLPAAPPTRRPRVLPVLLPLLLAHRLLPAVPAAQLPPPDRSTSLRSPMHTRCARVARLALPSLWIV
jgi:hypothetical protein